MGFKKMVFWAHLIVAIPASVFILIMAVTGVALTYQAQLIESAAQRNNIVAVSSTPAMSLDALLAGSGVKPKGNNPSLVLNSDPTIPVRISMGREGNVLLNPYTGAVIEDQAAGRRSFFGLMNRLHTNLNSSGDSAGGFLIKASNAIFLFLAISGVYLWLPGVYRWVQFRARMLFKGDYANSKARDYNWHHVFSFWAFIPLFVITLTGVVISYDVVNKALFAMYGEQVPERPEGPGGAPGANVADMPRAHGASFDAIVATAKAQLSNWQTLTVPLASRGDTLTVVSGLKSEVFIPPQQRLVLNKSDASVVELGKIMGAGGVERTPAVIARIWVRFAHTGEQYGVIGQTIAGLTSLAICFLVYTGLALAYRRLIVPLYRKV